MDSSTKRCSRCRGMLPATLDDFHRGATRFGLSSACKPCCKESSHDWYMAHRTETLQRTKLYAQGHLEQKRQAVRNYRLRHPERKKLQAQQMRQKRILNGKALIEYQQRIQSGRGAQANKKYRSNHPERLRQSRHKHLQKLKAQGTSTHYRWKKNHPDMVATKNRIRTIDRQDMKRYGITAMGIYQRDGGKCHICHRRVSLKTFSRDHIIPKSRGGNGAWENLALAHLRCNIKRGVDRMPAQDCLF